MVKVKWLHFLTPLCLPQVTLLNTAVSGEVNSLSVYFEKDLSSLVLLSLCKSPVFEHASRCVFRVFFNHITETGFLNV